MIKFQSNISRQPYPYTSKCINDWSETEYNIQPIVNYSIAVKNSQTQNKYSLFKQRCQNENQSFKLQLIAKIEKLFFAIF